MNQEVKIKSFRDLEKAGALKRADASKIDIDQIHFRPGFNVDGRVSEIGADGKYLDEEDQSLFDHIMAGGTYPAIEVIVRPEGGVYVVEGHRRVALVRRAVADGAPIQDKDGIVRMACTQFVGNDIDQAARIVTSNSNKKLTALQLCEIYKRLAGFGLSKTEIARKVNRSVAHVEQTLLLANANHDVQQLVKTGAVSATLAMSTVREHGEKAGDVLRAGVAKARESGKERATAKTTRPAPAITDTMRVDFLNKADAQTRRSIIAVGDVRGGIDALLSK